jgi:hypothetical protein
MTRVLRENRIILAACILTAGLVATPSVVEAAIAGTAYASGTGTAYCPSGYRVSGGGFRLPTDTYYATSSTEYKIVSSAQASTTSWRATAWKVTGARSSSGVWGWTKTAYSPTAFVSCVK